jgi:oxygen-dependent protoporphyrinogen oxidase
MTSKRIVIVGAGIAGLTAAYFLKQGGYQPLVYEASDRVGGRMISDVVNGFTIDGGAQFLTDNYPILTDLIDRLGLSSTVIEISPHVGTVRNGKIRKTRASDRLSPLKSGLLSIPGWLRFAFLSLRLQAQIKALPLNDFAAWTSYDDMDAETWSNAYFGAEITDYIVEPPIAGLAFQSLRENSRALPIATMALLLYGKARLRTLTGGIRALPECLATEVEVQLNSPIKAMSISESGVELEVGTERIIADSVILATPASVSRTLYKEPSLIERELLATPYSSTLNVALAADDSFRIDPDIADLYGFMIPKKERGILASIANEGCKDKRRLADGQLILTFVSGEAASEMINWQDQAILSAVLQDLEKYYTGISGHVLFTKIYRWKEAVPISWPGRSKQIAQYRKRINHSTKVLLAGDYMGMPFMEGAAETGKWAAQSVINYLA